MTDNLENPFAPGIGRYPPVLAGRAGEQKKLREGLRRLRPGQQVNPLLLSAPRGLGKTVLLHWLQLQARDAQVEIRRTNAKALPTLAALVELLAPTLLEEARAGGWDIGASFMGTGAQLGSSRGEAATEPPWLLRLHRALLEAHRKQPLLVSIDEAHNLEPEVAVGLANLIQDLTDQGCPVWLVLAGTPGLLHRLRRAGAGHPDSPNPSERVDRTASFIERADKLYPGLLPPSAAREAVAAPLRQRGWQVDAATLEAVIADAQGYPYFLQCWGAAMWDAGVAQRRVDTDIVDAARAAVGVERETLYDGRFRELHARSSPSLDADHTLQAAAAVAATWLADGEQPLTEQAFYRALTACGVDADQREVLRELFDHSGFLLDQRGEWQPGIPSLARYVHQRALALGILTPPDPTP